ncbi:unnamed protein product [Bursaphelenchus xylophilus]|uniref:(pine wood nematode) hypothetical protein n=1 Tax=Bursaphelenchus xylophilus TaxID=6326 RepID=A0A1I7SCA4_BURXY|nr:unnamed protein product [Bursaphelenchus xylophilus]CAG9094475.1 unnamed protein product [Bursaphelenchus xylophilus]
MSDTADFGISLMDLRKTSTNRCIQRLSDSMGALQIWVLTFIFIDIFMLMLTFLMMTWEYTERVKTKKCKQKAHPTVLTRGMLEALKAARKRAVAKANQVEYKPELFAVDPDKTIVEYNAEMTDEEYAAVLAKKKQEEHTAQGLTEEHTARMGGEDTLKAITTVKKPEAVKSKSLTRKNEPQLLESQSFAHSSDGKAGSKKGATKDEKKLA